MSLTPASVAFVCSICLLWEYFRRTFKSCIVLLHTLFSHFHKRTVTLPVLSSTFRNISTPSFAVASTSLRLILFRHSFLAAFVDFCYIVRWFWFIERNVYTVVLRSFVNTRLWSEGGTPFDCHFRRVDAVAVPITSSKMSKEGKPSLIFLIPASPVERVGLLAGFAAHFDDKMWRLSMEMANIERHSLAALDLVLLQTVRLSYR